MFRNALFISAALVALNASFTHAVECTEEELKQIEKATTSPEDALRDGEPCIDVDNLDFLCSDQCRSLYESKARELPECEIAGDAHGSLNVKKLLHSYQYLCDYKVDNGVVDLDETELSDIFAGDMSSETSGAGEDDSEMEDDSGLDSGDSWSSGSSDDDEAGRDSADEEGRDNSAGASMRMSEVYGNLAAVSIAAFLGALGL